MWELSSNMMQMFYNRPATCDYLGSLDQGLTFSDHALILCDDLAGLLKKMWEGLRVSPEQIGTDLIRDLGPRGQFLAEVGSPEVVRPVERGPREAVAVQHLVGRLRRRIFNISELFRRRAVEAGLDAAREA